MQCVISHCVDVNTQACTFRLPGKVRAYSEGMNGTTNTEETLATADAETVIALDALEAQDPRSAALLVGAPCTIGIGSDSYAGKIVRVTPSLHTIEVEYVNGKRRSFRKSKGGGYWSGKYYHLTIGIAKTDLDLGF